MAGAHVFRASRLSRGNLLFPTQVAVTPTSVVHYTPQWVGGREQSMHLAHVASVRSTETCFFADVMIESSGGVEPGTLPRPQESGCDRDEAADRAVPVGVLPLARRRRRHGRGTAAGMSAENAGTARRPDPAEVEARFHALVQSPLRAGLLRFLCARPEEVVRGRGADADVRAHAARRRELPARAGRRSASPRKLAGPGTPRYGSAQPAGDGAPRAARRVPRTARRRSATRIARPRCSASAR